MQLRTLAAARLLLVCRTLTLLGSKLEHDGLAAVQVVVLPFRHS